MSKSNRYRFDPKTGTARLIREDKFKVGDHVTISAEGLKLAGHQKFKNREFVVTEVMPFQGAYSDVAVVDNEGNHFIFTERQLKFFNVKESRKLTIEEYHAKLARLKV